MICKLTAVATSNFTDLYLTDELENKLRRADLFTRGVVACCHDLLQDQTIDGKQTGLFISTAFGPMQCNLDVLDFLVENEPVSPTLFSHSVFNGASGYVARIFGIFGPAITQTSYSFPFFMALEQARFAIEQGQIKQAIVIQAETYSQLLFDARGTQNSQWPPGAVAWLLGTEGIQIHRVVVQETDCPPASRRHYQATGSTGITHSHPLSMGFELSTLWQHGQLPEMYEINSDFGHISVHFGKQT